MVTSITIGNTTFNLPMASAANQRTAMSIISRFVMANAISLAKLDQKIDPSFIKGVLFSLTEKDLTQLSDLLLGNCMVHGEKSALDIKFFQGKMNTYYTLIAEATCYNLADFFTWLDDERSAVSQANSTAAE